VKQPEIYDCQGICPKCNEFVLTGKTDSDKYYSKYYSMKDGVKTESLDKEADSKIEETVLKVLHKDCNQAIVLTVKKRSYEKNDNEIKNENLWKSFIRFIKTFLRVG